MNIVFVVAPGHPLRIIPPLLLVKLLLSSLVELRATTTLLLRTIGVIVRLIATVRSRLVLL